MEPRAIYAACPEKFQLDSSGAVWKSLRVRLTFCTSRRAATRDSVASMAGNPRHGATRYRDNIASMAWGARNLISTRPGQGRCVAAAACPSRVHSQRGDRVNAGWRRDGEEGRSIASIASQTKTPSRALLPVKAQLEETAQKHKTKKREGTSTEESRYLRSCIRRKT